MTMREKEDDLFRQWKDTRPNVGFAPDGIVSEEDYRNSDLKLVFILKEVNDPGSEGWDLREYLEEGAPGGGSTWNNVARWVHGIRNRHDIQSRKKQLHWQEKYETIDLNFRKEQLKNICAVNLKKKPGKSSADARLLRSTAIEDKDYIRRQYELYDPDLTMCCGRDLVSSLFAEDVMGYNASVWKQTSRGVWWIEREAGKYIVEVNHPQQYTLRDSLMFYELIDAVNELLPVK